MSDAQPPSENPARDAAAPPQTRQPAAVAQPGEPPTTPQISRDEANEGWGDRHSGFDDDWYERERPPHHG